MKLDGDRSMYPNVSADQTSLHRAALLGVYALHGLHSVFLSVAVAYANSLTALVTIKATLTTPPTGHVQVRRA